MSISMGILNMQSMKASGRGMWMVCCAVPWWPTLFGAATQGTYPCNFAYALGGRGSIVPMVALKGFGSENMSRMKMFTPSASLDDIVGFVAETARVAGSNSCPPMVLGVGIGGDFEKCAILQRWLSAGLFRRPNPDPFYAELEKRMLDEVNALGIGPQGFGGDTTALCVHIESFPTHIAGLPVAVNVGCHVTRHKKITI